MINFITDNFKVGDNIKINCNGHTIDGILVGFDDLNFEIKDKNDVIHQIQGNIIQNFREIQSRPADSMLRATISNGNNHTGLTTKENGNIHETDTEKQLKMGPKIIGKIQIDGRTSKRGNGEKNMNGHLPYDGEIKAFKDEWDYCFVTDYNNPSIDRIHLKLTDFFDAEDMNYKGKLKKGLRVHYYLFQDKSGYHAHVAFHDMPIDKYLEECRNSEIERERKRQNRTC